MFVFATHAQIFQHENTPPHILITEKVDFELPPEFSDLKEKKPVTEEAAPIDSNTEEKVEKEKPTDQQPSTATPKAVSLLKSDTPSTKTPKVPKEGVRKDSESKGAGDQETPKAKKPRQAKSESLMKSLTNSSSSSKKKRTKEN